MKIKTGKTKRGKGVLSKLTALLERNRLGELLVLNGHLTPQDLRYALAHQKTTRNQLGRILIDQRLVSRQALYRTLAQQWTMRCLIALMTITVSCAITAKSAKASGIKDLPPETRIVLTSSFSAAVAYPALFGTEERQSGNIEPFTKWTGMFQRFEASMTQPGTAETVAAWQNSLRPLQGLPLDQMATRVNSMMNAKPYVADTRNWGKSDYWQTPVEFLTRGGDCEDYAIAKYASLRSLGVPENRMRIAIVQDLQKNIPHAVLIVYTDNDALILDNQVPQALSINETRRYKPVFSINRTAWWLHTAPKPTLLASAR